MRVAPVLTLQVKEMLHQVPSTDLEEQLEFLTTFVRDYWMGRTEPLPMVLICGDERVPCVAKQFTEHSLRSLFLPALEQLSLLTAPSV